MSHDEQLTGLGTVEELATAIAQRVSLPKASGRVLVALAGPPASGKSTLADHLVAQVNDRGRQAVLVPMDGFHLDNAILDARGLRGRKGAPETFDVDGLCSLVGRLQTGAALYAPAFDRARDVSLNAAIHVPVEADVIVLEGNYLLLDAPGWRDLAPFWDLSVMINVPRDELHRRLMARWTGYGLPIETARAKTEGNDMPNADLVLSGSVPADLTLDVGS